MEMTKPKNSFAVICHGDLWLSNILFKYNAIPGTNGSSDEDQIEIRPVEVKFIDFQSARFASLATDLVLFLFTSVRVSFFYYGCHFFCGKKFFGPFVTHCSMPEDFFFRIRYYL